MGNQLKVGSLINPTRANGGITTGVIAVLPCRQATTDSGLVDISGNANPGLPGAAFVAATAFASPQGILTADAATTDTTCYIPLAKFNYSYNAGDTLLIASRIKLAALPGATKPVWAQGGNNSTAQGLGLRVKVNGALTLQLDGPASSYYTGDTDAGGPAGNGLLTASVWHHVVFAIWNADPVAGTANFGIWINGVRAFSTADKAVSGWPSAVTPTEGLRIGQYYRSTGPTTLSLGATQSDFHAYRSPKEAIFTQAQLDAIANRLFRDPSRPLSAAEWRMQ